jgi:hypothetical protein
VVEMIAWHKYLISHKNIKKTVNYTTNFNGFSAKKANYSINFLFAFRTIGKVRNICCLATLISLILFVTEQFIR